MRNLINKRKKFLSKARHAVDEKYRYTKDMFKAHEILFEYSQLIENTPIKKIEIDSNRVIFTIHNAGKDILMCCDARDVNSMPLSCINFAAYDEAEEMDMALRLIKPKDVVFDIGSNIGWYAINILLQKKDAEVYCFEPIKSSFSCSIENFRLNNLKTDKIYNFGLSDENKKIKFYFDIECAMASSMSNLRKNKATVTQKCEVRKMDDFVLKLPSFGKLDFIKCDVEGAEFLVFRGGLETIKKFKPIIFTEMLRKWSKKFDYHPDDIIKLFRSVGYECFVTHGKKLRKFGWVGDKTKEKNYLFLHSIKHKQIIKKLTIKKQSV